VVEVEGVGGGGRLPELGRGGSRRGGGAGCEEGVEGPEAEGGDATGRIEEGKRGAGRGCNSGEISRTLSRLVVVTEEFRVEFEVEEGGPTSIPRP
jgi:hypothetical protein